MDECHVFVDNLTENRIQRRRKEMITFDFNTTLALVTFSSIGISIVSMFLNWDKSTITFLVIAVVGLIIKILFLS